MATRPITINDIDEAVEAGGILLIDFWAAWCGPCRAFAPVFEQASETHPDIVFGKVDTEAEPQLAAGFRITSIPTLVAFRDGIIVYAQPGAMNAAGLEKLIEAIRALDMDEIRADIAKQQQEVAK